ncbi:hypothetical protein ACJ41O_004545 [Fusarium nematophilum]
MAPSDEDIEQALLDATYRVYSTTPDETSVNKVRKQAEQSLGLADGFLSTDDWKQKSKTLIKGRVEKLLDGWVPETQDGAKSNDDAAISSAVKRGSSEIGSPQPKPKRQKRGPKPKKPAKKLGSDLSDLSDLSELSELSELSDEEKPKKRSDEEKPQKKRRRKRGRAKRRSKPVDLDDENAAAVSNDGTPDPRDTAKDQGGDETATNGENGKEEQASINQETPDDNEKPAVDEEEEYSDVIDEPVKPKRKKKDKKEAVSKPTKASKAANTKSATSDDPNTEEIKKLQSHLIKCGVRKLWHNELKKYGDDSKAKIRHLKEMLADAGMEGRFSEAKAREIKERRELMAEAEAAKEMNALWGVEGRGRASRSKSKSAKVVESEDSNDEGGNAEDDEEEETYAARRRRARADLAFLGDDSDSD